MSFQLFVLSLARMEAHVYHQMFVFVRRHILARIVVYTVSFLLHSFMAIISSYHTIEFETFAWRRLKFYELRK